LIGIILKQKGVKMKIVYWSIVWTAIVLLAIGAALVSACDDCIPVPSKIVVNRNTYHTDNSVTNESKSYSSSNSFSDADANSMSLSDAAASGGDAQSSVEITDHSQTTNIDRRYVNPGNVPIPTVPGFYVWPTVDPSFRPMQDMYDIYGDPFRITEGALERLAKGGKVDVNFLVTRGQDEVARVYTGHKEWKWLWVGSKPYHGLSVTAMVDGKADSGDTNSMQVFGKMGLAALKDGNNWLVITRENHHRRVEGSGWGVGLYTAGGLNSSNGQQSITPGGGTGYASSKTGTQDLPWIHGYAGCLPMVIH
jgi:hypothetical protein